MTVVWDSRVSTELVKDNRHRRLISDIRNLDLHLNICDKDLLALYSCMLLLSHFL